VLHSDWSSTGCEVHKNFADESAYLMADNIWNELVTVHISQVLKMLCRYTQISFAIVSLKKYRYNNPPCTYSTPEFSFHWMEQDLVS
jgi:hypothetical protein